MIGTDIHKAAELLKNGSIIGIPTETVYGLAGNALNPDAVIKIFEAKNRPLFDPLIIHSNSIEKVNHYVAEIPPSLLTLAEAFWPGPLTLLLPRKSCIPDIVTSGLDRVAVRIPNHPMTLRLLELLDFPLAAPSANPFGYISPTTAQHVAQQLESKIPYILDGGPCQIGLESTIVGLNEKKDIQVYRLGGLSLEQIEQVMGEKVILQLNQSSNPHAPGQLKSHYAPRKPMLLLKSMDLEIDAATLAHAAFLGFEKYHPAIPKQDQLLLSEKGDFSEAAKNLFAYLRHLDQSPAKTIISVLLPENFLGRAINDRLKRAATRA